MRGLVFLLAFMAAHAAVTTLALFWVAATAFRRDDPVANAARTAAGMLGAPILRVPSASALHPAGGPPWSLSSPTASSGPWWQRSWFGLFAEIGESCALRIGVVSVGYSWT
jgi:hypothetical protein